MSNSSSHVQITCERIEDAQMAADMSEHLPDVLPIRRPKPKPYELYSNAPVVVTLTFPAWTQADGAWIRAVCRAALQAYPRQQDPEPSKGPLSKLLHRGHGEDERDPGTPAPNPRLKDLFGHQPAPIDADEIDAYDVPDEDEEIPPALIDTDDLPEED